MHRATVVLPLPDSPTSATHSPFSMVRSTPSTARRLPTVPPSSPRLRTVGGDHRAACLDELTRQTGLVCFDPLIDGCAGVVDHLQDAFG